MSNISELKEIAKSLAEQKNIIKKAAEDFHFFDTFELLGKFDVQVSIFAQLYIYATGGAEIYYDKAVSFPEHNFFAGYIHISLADNENKLYKFTAINGIICIYMDCRTRITYYPAEKTVKVMCAYFMKFGTPYPSKLRLKKDYNLFNGIIESFSKDCKEFKRHSPDYLSGEF